MNKTLLMSGLWLALLLSTAQAAAPVADAAESGDAAAVRTLLQRKADVNATQADGMTALHWATVHDDVAIAKALLQAGAKPGAETRLGVQPLFIAAKAGSARLIAVLLSAGAAANSANSTGATPLMLAAASGSSAAVDVLLSAGAEVNRKESAHGQTALMFAAAADRGAAVSTLIRHGADAEITTLTSEPRCGSLFANPSCRPEPAPSKADDGVAGSPAPAPAKAPRRKKGVTVIGGMTALLYASRDGHLDAAHALVEAGANINNPGVGEKMTPLVMAISNGHYELALYLLNHGADPNLASGQGATALYSTLDMEWAPYAYRPQPIAGRGETSYLDLMKALLDHGANPDAKLTQKVWFRSLPEDRTWVEPDGATAFWRAAQAADVDAMRLLVQAGANPKLASDEGVTPLMVAAGLGWGPNFSRNVQDAWLAAAKYCLELGLDPNAKNQKGYTALHGAAFLGHNELIEYLVANGADPRATTNDKNTVADMANGPFPHSILRPDTVSLLERLGSGNSNNCRADTCVVPAKAPRNKPE
jgi:uncharacterized protein